MEEHIYYNDLFDCYKNLLTEKEIEYFSSYYTEDLTLSEIADNTNVSRAAVHKTVKNVIEKLENYEKELHLLEIKNKLQTLLTETNIEVIHTEIEKILDK